MFITYKIKSRFLISVGFGFKDLVTVRLAV